MRVAKPPRHAISEQEGDGPIDLREAILESKAWNINRSPSAHIIFL